MDSVTPGTAANRLRQAQIYIKFALAYHVCYLNPTVFDLSMYVRFLANSFKSPDSTKNYLAGAKTWVQNHMGNIHSFLSPQVHDMVQAITKTSSHVVSPAYPISPADLAIICEFIDANPWIPLCCKPALLITYATFLRSSNIVSPSLSSWGGPHTLRCIDVRQSTSGLAVIIRSTKTLSKGRPTILHVNKVSNHPLCPVQAWEEYVTEVNPSLYGPAFVLTHYLPLTAKPLVKIMRAALKQRGLEYAGAISMHSLRRGAAQAASAAGAEEKDLLTHGTWKSKTVLKKYLNSPTIVPRLMAKSLAG